MSFYSLDSGQREKVKQFRGITSTTQKVAINFLKKANWKLEIAMDNYFNGPSMAVQSSGDYESVYKKYQKMNDEDDEDEDAIKGEAMIKFFEDLDLDPASINSLVVCFKFNLSEAYTIKKKELEDGWNEHGIRDMKGLKGKVRGWVRELSSADVFKNFYRYCFQYSKPPGSRTLPLEVAIPLWNLVLEGKYKKLDQWCDFVENEYKRAISKDTWSQFLEFTRKVKLDCSDYDENGSWPCLIDDFVEHVKKK